MAFVFDAPAWDSNAKVDKAFKQLFNEKKIGNKKIENTIKKKNHAEKQVKLSSNMDLNLVKEKRNRLDKNKKSNKPKVQKLSNDQHEVKIGYSNLSLQKKKHKTRKFKKSTETRHVVSNNKDSLTLKSKHNVWKEDRLQNTMHEQVSFGKGTLNTVLQKQHGKSSSQTTKEKSKSSVQNDESGSPKLSKKTSKQTLHSKPKNQQAKIPRFERTAFDVSMKRKLKMSLRERMVARLQAARFRYLNEQMYTTVGQDSKRYFEQNEDDYKAYHQGYRQQVSKWPLNPLDIIIGKINKMPKNLIIADFGCGEAKLSKSVVQTVHSFDLVALDDTVTACDMSKVPLQNNTVDVVVFCLSLMGTNLKDYIHEAARILKLGGMLKIADVESRFNNVDNFIHAVQKYGFSETARDLSHDLFWFIDFIKKTPTNIQKRKLPEVHLNPCLYKKR